MVCNSSNQHRNSLSSSNNRSSNNSKEHRLQINNKRFKDLQSLYLKYSKVISIMKNLRKP